jgi:hypothetical protein
MAFSPFFKTDLLNKISVLPDTTKFTHKNPTNPIHLVNREFFQNALYNFTGDKNQLFSDIISRVKTGCMKIDKTTNTFIADEKVSEAYVVETIQNCIADKTDKYDIIAATQNNIIVALAIVNKGECGYYPNIYALQLICAGPNILQGSVLLAIYLLGLIYNGMPLGLLEVAGSYDNLGALCAYDKFGFVENYVIKHEDVCFYGNIEDYDTLPMFIDVGSMTPELILDTLVNAPGKSIINKKEPLCYGFKNYIKSTNGISDSNELAIIEELNKFSKSKQNALAGKRLKNMNKIFGTGKGSKQSPIYLEKINHAKTKSKDPIIDTLNQQIAMLQESSKLETVNEIAKFKNEYDNYEKLLRMPKRSTRSSGRK